MPYIGNQHNVGDHVNNFKVLDDISSYTATFDGSATSVISTANNTIRIPLHRFIQGQRVTYNNGGGSNIGGLTSGTAYYVSFDSSNTIKLATSLSNANSNTVINLSSVGGGSSHTLNAAFDGINTKFKVTYASGKAARFNNATQLNVAINNVIQRPNLSAASFTEGFAIEDNHKIVFKTAPTVNDVFWGSIIANTIENFDLRDNEVDNFTGNGSATEFNLSTIPANNESVIVTIDGVLQHPSDKNTSRAYTLLSNIIQFTAAPALNAEIQVRHIGFAGASTNDVSGFYGRTGNVTLTANDHITTGDITARNFKATGISTFSGAVSTGAITATTGTFSGNVSIGGTLTYEDVTNIDSVGIITAQSDVHVGAGVSVVGILTASVIKSTNLSSDRVVFTTTGGQLEASGNLTYDGVTLASGSPFDLNADLDVDGHTNLDNLSVAGISTFSGIVDAVNTPASIRVAQDIQHKGDATTKISFPTNGEISFDTSGHDRIYIKSNGNVGIGTDIPDQSLHVFNSTANNIALFESGDAFATMGLSDSNGSVSFLTTLGSLRIGVNGDAGTIGDNSTLAMAIKNNGSVGIGTDNPGYTLDVRADSFVKAQFKGKAGNENNIPFYIMSGSSAVQLGIEPSGGEEKIILSSSDDSIRFHTADNERLRIDSDGRLSLGLTASPGSYPVGATARQVQAEIKGIISGNNYHHGSLALNCTNNNANLHLVRSDNNQSGGVGLANISFTGYDGSDFHVAAQISAVRDAAGGNNDVPGRIEFKTTADGASTPTERLRIDSKGRVIIGHDSTPNAVASVAVVGSYGASSNLTPFIYICRDEAVANVQNNESLGQILFASRDGYRGAVIETRSAGTWNSSTSHANLIIKTTPSGSQVPTERLRITSDGSVGISSDTPQAKFDIYRDDTSNAGTIQITQDGAGDAAIDFQLKGIREYTLGIDNSDGDKFKLSGSAGLENDTLLTVTNDGSVGISTTIPTAKLSVGNVTGAYINADGIQVNRPHSLGLKNGILVYSDAGYNPTASYRAAAFKAVGTTGAAFGVSTDQGSNGLGGTLNARIDFSGGGYFLGNIGVGTESPNHKLHVQADNPTIALESNTTTGNTNIVFGDSGSETMGKIQYHNNGDYMRFYTNGNNEVMRLTHESKVGIVEEDPDVRLQIGGSTVNANNALKLGKRVTSSNTNLPIIGHHSADGTGSGLALCSTSGSGAIHFFTGNNPAGFGNGNNDERLRITSNGSVNIGDDYAQTTYKTQIETTNGNVLRLVTDSDDANGPELVLRKDSASPANSDNVGNIYFQGNDSGGNDTFYASMEAYSSVVANGSETGYIRFRARNAGTMEEKLLLKGDGTIRASGAAFTDTDIRLVLTNPTNNSGSQMQFQTNSTGSNTTNGFRVGYNGSGGQLWLFESQYLRFATSNLERFQIRSNGSMIAQTGSLGTVPLMELYNTDGNASTGTVLKLRSGRGQSEKDMPIFHITDNSDSSVFEVENSGRVGIFNPTPAYLLDIKNNTSGEGIRLRATGSTYHDFIFDAARSGANQNIGRIRGVWNGNNTSMISFLSGSDTTNKDNGFISFAASEAGSSPIERFRCNGSSAGLVMQNDCYISIPHDEVCILFDEGQKFITSNDGQGNFNIMGGKNHNNQHVSSSSGTSGVAQICLSSDGTNGRIDLAVGPRREAGEAANVIHGLAVSYVGSGLNGLLYTKTASGAASPTSLGGNYPILHKGNASDGTWANVAGDGFKVLGDGGSIAITTNDGYGNCNVCWNHKDGIPDTNGSSWRIRADIDSANSHFFIQNSKSVTSGSAAGMTTRFEIDENGNGYINGNSFSSDQRLKKNIKNITGATDKIKSLTGRTFEWKEELEFGEGTKYGFVAQELETVLPELISKALVHFDKDGNIIQDNYSNKDEIVDTAKTINTVGVIPVLVEALKDALSEIDSLKARVAALEGS